MYFSVLSSACLCLSVFCVMASAAVESPFGINKVSIYLITGLLFSRFLDAALLVCSVVMTITARPIDSKQIYVKLPRKQERQQLCEHKSIISLFSNDEKGRNQQDVMVWERN